MREFMNIISEGLTSKKERKDRVTEAEGAFAVREIAFTGRRDKAEHCVHVVRNLYEPNDVQVHAKITRVGLWNATVKMTVIGPPRAVEQLAALVSRGKYRDLTIVDPDAS